jgi:UDP:flavonoid glycosyltransferase YjiC (YdhE family)
MNFKSTTSIDLSPAVSNGKRILFATFPADGHFNPLTGLAVHLKQVGYDVRWYTSRSYSGKLSKLNIIHYPFIRAIDVESNNFDHVFPERAGKKSQLSKLNFDLIHAFILRGPEYYGDLMEIYETFPFDLLVADSAFTGIPFVKEKMNIPVVSIGVMPLIETSKDLAPSGIGMTPANTKFGRLKQSFLRFLADKILFGRPNRIMRKILDEYEVPHNGENIFDLGVRKANLFLQSGTPGFEYKRSDLGQNIRFIGALLPHKEKRSASQWHHSKINLYDKVILVTQGTVEKDVTKIIEPTLEAFKDSQYLVIVTTGGSKTNELRAKFPQSNIIIEDFIPFEDVMPYCDVYITNGGYGGVMLGIEHGIPLVVAGIHEGKNEINARVGYFHLGINLETERPSPDKIKKAIEAVFRNSVYRQNVQELAEEFERYSPNELTENYVALILRNPSKTTFIPVRKKDKVY